MEEKSYWKMRKKREDKIWSTGKPDLYSYKLSSWIHRKYFRKSGKLLDLGCGRLFFFNAFKKLGYNVSGCDIEPFNSKIKKVDLEKNKLSYPHNYFDFIFCRNVIEHLSSADNMLKESFRVLKPGGKIFIMTADAHYWDSFRALMDHYDHKRLYTLNSAVEGLTIFGFKIVEKKHFRNFPFFWKYTDLAFEFVYPSIINFIVIGRKNEK